MGLLLSLALAACTGGVEDSKYSEAADPTIDNPVRDHEDSTDTDTGDTDTGDTDTGDTDTADTADTSETGDTADTSDTGVEPVFGAWTFGGLTDVVDATDLAVDANNVYVVGTDSSGSAGVFAVSMADGSVTTLASGDPLVLPTGITVSADGATLYVSDAAANPGEDSTNGGVYSLPIGGGTPTEIGTSGVIDLPGDVVADADGSTLWVSGFQADGTATVFSVDASSGAATASFAGGSLVDPTQLAVTADGAMVYVLDSRGASNKAAIFEIVTSDGSTSELESWFDVSFPGGVALDDSDSMLFYTTIGDPGLSAVHLDGSGSEEYDTLGLLELPAGVASMGSSAYVADESSLAASDIYLLTF